MAVFEKPLVNNPTHWWVLIHAYIEALLRISRPRMKENPVHEIYIAEPDSSLEVVAKGWNPSTYRSAIGPNWSSALETLVER